MHQAGLPPSWGVEKDMRRIALVIFAVGSLAVAGQALAGPGGRYGYGGGYHGGRGYYHGGGGGNVAAALFGGAILGVVAGSIISNANNREVVVERPVYVEPAPVYVEPARVYVEPASCYDSYRGVYVRCDSLGYAPPPAVYREPAPQPSSGYYNEQPNYAQRQDAPPRAQQNNQRYQTPQYQDPQYQQPLQTVQAPAQQPIPSVYADGARPVGDRYGGPAGGR
ncbi:hypothetical protein [Pigmentiphaga aceris]|uniref:hypothetical protein n=1 Tax=Pigmentiphaga aceris TaxID=1940612 RepID=UPI001FE6AA5A|nr:hypothetical protein [Pigmentiphaga aceris]